MQSAVPLVGAACGLLTLEEPAAASVVAATRRERAAAPATRKRVSDHGGTVGSGARPAERLPSRQQLDVTGLGR